MPSMRGEQDDAASDSNPTRRRVLLVGVGLITVCWAAALAALVYEEMVAWALVGVVLGTIWTVLLWRYALRQ